MCSEDTNVIISRNAKCLDWKHFSVRTILNLYYTFADGYFLLLYRSGIKLFGIERCSLPQFQRRKQEYFSRLSQGWKTLTSQCNYASNPLKTSCGGPLFWGGLQWLKSGSAHPQCWDSTCIWLSHLPVCLKNSSSNSRNTFLILFLSALVSRRCSSSTGLQKKNWNFKIWRTGKLLRW